MSEQGVFGYIIGKKKRMMRISHDADLLWQILVREIYVIMKHYGSKELVVEAFEKIKSAPKSPPKRADIEKYRIFTDLAEEAPTTWYSLLEYCQGSFINVLEAGYIVNHPDDNGNVVMLDFNKWTLRYYYKGFSGTAKELETATIEEIMSFDEMPTKSYQTIVDEMRDKFTSFNNKFVMVEDEINKLNDLIVSARKECSYNIEDKVKKLLDDMNTEKRKLNMKRRVFYYRLKALDLIEAEQDANQ